MNNLVSKSQLAFSFEESVIYFLISNSIEPVNITSLNNENSNIMVLTKHIQSNHDTDIIPLDEVDKCGGYVYAISYGIKLISLN